MSALQLSLITDSRRRRRPRPEPEQLLVRDVLRFLRENNIVAWRQNQGVKSGRRDNGERYFVRFSEARGISDIIGILPDGRFLAIECKAEGGSATDDQREFLAMVNREGGIGLVAYTVGDVATALNLRGGR